MMVGTPDGYLERIQGALDVEGMIETCQELVRIPSLSFQEAEVAEVLAARLRSLGYDRVEVDEQHNVVAWLEGESSHPSVMTNGHLDHVPPQTMENPYSGVLVDGARWGEEGMAIYGRGTMDMKCNVVAAAYAGAAINRAGIPLAGTYIFTADIAEEVDSPLGIASVLEAGLTADYGISVEATRLQPYLGHRGKVEFELSVLGRTSHSSNPDEGDNAVVRMSRLLRAIERWQGPLASHPILGEGSLAITDIKASPGGGVAVVPDRCTIRIDRRFVPGETPESLQRELEEIAADVLRDDPDFRYEIEVVNIFPLMWIEPDHPLVEATQTARETVLGGRGELGGWLFGVNATWMGEAGIPTVGLGPGNEHWAHKPDEHVPVADVVAAAEMYAMLIVGLCGVAA